MYRIEVHRRIEQIISLFYYIGVWHKGSRTVFLEWCLKSFHLGLCIWHMITIFIGFFASENIIGMSFIGACGIISFNVTVRLGFFLWKQDRIIQLIRSLGAHLINNSNESDRINLKINIFIKFALLYQFILFFTVPVVMIIPTPIISDEKTLPFNPFPTVNWKNNYIGYWIAFVVVFYMFIINVVFHFFNILIWYMMISCGIKYQILGNAFKNLGKATLKNVVLSKSEKVSDSKEQVLFLSELMELIQFHQNLLK